MWKKVMLLVVVMALLGVVPATARTMRHGGGLNQLDVYRLVFNDEQNKKLDALLTPTDQDFRPLYKQRMAEQRTLRDMLKSDATKDADIRAQVTKISDIDYQIALKKASLIRAARKIATPEQLAKIDALEAKRVQRREKVTKVKDSQPIEVEAPAN